MEKDNTKALSHVIRIDDERIQDHLGKVVRGSVEETLNALLDAEADRLCNAERYERSEARRDTRAGSYERKLQTRAGEVSLKVPKLRRQTFETAIIERYRRREASVEEALMEMYLAGVSVRRVEDITEALWGTRVSPGTVSNLNKKIYEQIDAWRNKPIAGDHHLHELTDGFHAERVIGEWIGFYNTERPHSSLGGKTPAEAYAAGQPVDMLDKTTALPTSPQAQQQKSNMINRILTA